MERAGQVDGDDGIPVLIADRFDRLMCLAQDPAGHVDQNVRPALHLPDPRHKRVDRILIGEVKEPPRTYAPCLPAGLNALFHIGFDCDR
jgi:hypothetical protein